MAIRAGTKYLVAELICWHSRGDERRNSPDMRFQGGQALLKETLTLCEQSPDQLLRTAFRSALTHVIASYGLQDKDRGLAHTDAARQSGLAFNLRGGARSECR